jgi:hypothetical protein
MENQALLLIEQRRVCARALCLTRNCERLFTLKPPRATVDRVRSHNNLEEKLLALTVNAIYLIFWVRQCSK